MMSKQIADYEHKTQENEMANLKRRFKKHGVTDDDLESQCSDISVNSKAIAVEIKLLRKSLKKLDAELSGYKKSHGELTEENEQLRVKVKTTTKEHAEMERTVLELRVENDKTRLSLNISQERIRLLQAKGYFLF